MKRRYRSVLVVAVASFLLAPWTTAAEPLNVLMIAVDDMNSWIGALRGPAKTPNIDRLAAQGVLFSNAHVVVPACNPSRVALMTSQRPETTGQYENAGNFRERPGGAERITLPQFLASHGYDAVAAGKIFHNSRGTGDEPRPLSDPVSWRTQRKGGIGTPGGDLYRDENGIPTWHGGRFENRYANQGIFWGPIPHATEETGDWQTADYCVDYLKQDHDKPFFLACGIFRPHNPLLAPQEFFNLYPLDEIELPPAPPDDFKDIPETAHRNWSTPVVEAMKELGEWPKAVQAYLASISFADACIGHVLNELENSAYRDNTIVILWGDHGWHLGDKERIEKFTLWRAATNAPLIFRMPGAEVSGVSEASVSFLDIYPTLVSLLGFDRPDGLEGHDFSHLLSDPAGEWPHPAIVTYLSGNFGVKHGRWNYIRYKDGSEELYNTWSDPWEHVNRVSDPAAAGRLDLMRGFLEAFDR